MQDGAVIGEVLGLASMEEDDGEEEMPVGDSPDKDNGFHIDCSIHHRCRDRLQELREEVEVEIVAIQPRVDEKVIALI
jgi:hypothetical protein